MNDLEERRPLHHSEIDLPDYERTQNAIQVCNDLSRHTYGRRRHALVNAARIIQEKSKQEK
jgi:hypothetical protein